MLQILLWNNHQTELNATPMVKGFIWFLERNGALYGPDSGRLISDVALVAMILMIAESRPEEKDVLVRIVMHLLCEKSR